HVWLPPAYKSAYGTEEPGYAVYDLYDLGEFDQKGSVRTRYGTREEYKLCIDRFHANNIQVVADIVLNHKHGADELENIPVRKVDPQNRNEFTSEEELIDAWTKFYFPGRNGKYSDFVWNWHSFTGISENHDTIYLILNEYANGQWEEMLEDEVGNYDYLMGADIEFRNPAVREELRKWGQWYMETMGIDGLRLDAVKHIHYSFFNEWLDYLKQYFNKDFLCIGEYWRSHPEPLLKYIEMTEGRIRLFDVPLHFNFHHASASNSDYDMSKILENTLLQHKPELTVTFVDNHDTQPLQSLQSPVEHWFKPLAYALILLREQGLPCVFYPALYEAKYVDNKDGEEIYVELNGVPSLELMLKVRKELAYGMQRDYFDHSNTIGWTREGVKEKKGSGCAVVITNGSAGNKVMEIGKKYAGRIFVDITGGRLEKVKINKDGWGEFFVADKSVSIWIAKTALALLH
ncbi:MAG TPA: alpha-amylase, partial [Chitinophagaceae bacterium]|nr:alpha-amylase [Chitinophagaceae bacterium]